MKAKRLLNMLKIIEISCSESSIVWKAPAIFIDGRFQILDKSESL